MQLFVVIFVGNRGVFCPTALWWLPHMRARRLYCSATDEARTVREMLSTSNRPSPLREMKPEGITSLDVSIDAVLSASAI